MRRIQEQATTAQRTNLLMLPVLAADRQEANEEKRRKRCPLFLRDVILSFVTFLITGTLMFRFDLRNYSGSWPLFKAVECEPVWNALGAQFPEFDAIYSEAMGNVPR
jgi:hypothetical protein